MFDALQSMPSTRGGESQQLTRFALSEDLSDGTVSRGRDWGWSGCGPALPRMLFASGLDPCGETDLCLDRGPAAGHGDGEAASRSYDVHA